MNITELQSIIKKHPNYAELTDWLLSNSKNLKINGFCGSSAALFLQTAQAQAQKPAIYILHDNEEAGYFYNDLVQITGGENVFYFPSSYKKQTKVGSSKDAANQVLRTETLNAITTASNYTIVTYPEAIAEKVIDPTLLDKETLNLKVGEQVSIDFITDLLNEYEFNKVDFVYEPGQYSTRGSLIDVYSYSNEQPYRIDFFGDEIDSIRTFDIENQISINTLKQISIISNTINTETQNLVPVFKFFTPDIIIASLDIQYTIDTIQKIHTENFDESDSFLSAEGFESILKTHKLIEWGMQAKFSARKSLKFDQEIQPIFHKNFDLTSDNFKQYQALGYNIFVVSDNPKQTERLKDIFDDRLDSVSFEPVIKTVHEGFIDNDLKICVYTDHQIFDRFHKYTVKSAKARAGKLVLSLKELMQFQIGDYIVHIDHGVGRFGGLIRTQVNGKMQEVIKLTFKDDDIIFVNIHSLHRISKYKSKEADAPKLNKLGTATWSNLKDKTKKKIKDIARELIALYAQRKQEKGFEFSADSYLQQELESSFLYEDTPDQHKATVDVKKDMESAKPMDRLVCGDVGFGKTEVAMRAAFKAVTDNKQVAVLVPTTVLAFQHYKSFKRRLKRFPCNIDYMSRARKSSDIKDIKSKIESGNIDIIIGTHKILSKDIRFKDLGLLIIDEEQKFGVSAKEKLKQIRANIDTLTLTATPIPRTLQFSLMGARDLSIISTAPPNRFPVHTELIELDREQIKEAIEFELSRGGQVFFVNNRVSNLADLEAFIHELVPQAKICIGHGQMNSEDLENRILNFINHEYDILIATTIIESGIDIPNVNTIFINNAQNFGLSVLHQLRGRVGRTNKKAFCYLITPPKSSLPTDARRRLQAIENFSDLGSGIHISMQDLDIRGAGNILGGEQSGFMADLGYETYHRILDEAVHELKYNEFSDVFEEEIKAKRADYTTDCAFESDLELLFPVDYIENISERMNLYKRLDNIKNEEELFKFEKELIDRFGAIPEKSQDLIKVISLRWIGQRNGIEKMTLKNNRLTAYFISDFKSPFYQSSEFNKILQYTVSHPKTCQLKENKGKRYLIVNNINSVAQAYDLMISI